MISDTGKKRRVVTTSQEIDSFIDPRHSRAMRWSMVCWQNVDTSRTTRVLCTNLNRTPDMCDPEEISWQGFDDVTGDYINPDKQARNEEMKCFRDMEVYENVSREEALGASSIV